MNADRERLVVEYNRLREQLARIERLLQAPGDVDDVKDDDRSASLSTTESSDGDAADSNDDDEKAPASSRSDESNADDAKSDFCALPPTAVSPAASVERGLRSAVAGYRFDGSPAPDLLSYFRDMTAPYKETLLHELHIKKGIKFTVCTQVEIEKSTASNTVQNPKLFSRVYEITNAHQIDEALEQAFGRVGEKLTKWTNEGSGWNLLSILGSFLNIFTYRPLTGSSYIALPKALKTRHAIVNVKNKDQQCFKWSVLAALHPVARDACRVTKYSQHVDELNFDGIAFPVSLPDVRRFEQQNNISINVYTFETPNDDDDEEEDSAHVIQQPTKRSRPEIIPLYVSKYRPSHAAGHVDLLSFGGGSSESRLSHYAWIKDFDRLMCNQTAQRTWHCRRCLHRFWVHDKYQEHVQRDCTDSAAAQVKLPPPHKAKLGFDQCHKQLPTPFYIVFDIESFLEKLPQAASGPASHRTVKTHQHVPCGYAFTTVCTYDDSLSRPIKLYRKQAGDTAGEAGVMRRLLDDLLAESARINKIMAVNHKMVLTAEDEASFQRATHCHICQQPLPSARHLRVRDHDHLKAGPNYRGAACYDCNLQYSYKRWKIPVIAHNLKGYDSHFIIRALHRGIKKVTCVPSNREKYLSFEFEGLRFIDSLSFLNTSLEQLVETLLKSHGSSAFPHTRALLMEKATATSTAADAQHQLRLLLRKGVYPYEYMDSVQRFSETRLPSREHFFSTLTDADISEHDYAHAQQVFRTFQLRDLGEYHDLYLRSDVALLTDVFENFRRLCLTKDGLDPTHYLSLPGYSFDNLLKRRWDQGHEPIQLFNEHQLDMYLFMEKAIRGGVCMISHRYAKANNRHHPESYDPTQPSSYIWYLDANHLYGWAMTQLLPIGDYRWLSESALPTWTAEIIAALDALGPQGYILEVDLDYPAALHDLHNDYPCAAAKMAVQDTMLSQHSRTLRAQLGMPPQRQEDSVNNEKLICSLGSRTRYPVHFRTLQLYMSLGLVVTKVHRVLCFRQQAWMKDYVDYNTTERARATTDFEKDFFKLKVCSCFGKTMENVRKRIVYEPVTTPERLIKLAAKPTFKRGTLLCESEGQDISVVGVELYKSCIRLNKPIFTGATILDLSKLLVLDFHYNTIKRKYGDRAKLLLTDTDSLMYHIETEDLYHDIQQDSTLYPSVFGSGGPSETLMQKLDSSDYPLTHPLYSAQNKKVVGKFKDESRGDVILEFAGLRPKVYSFSVGKNQKRAIGEVSGAGEVQEHKKAKGIQKCVVKHQLRHQQFVDCLKSEGDRGDVHTTSFQSHHHQVHTISATRRGLCAYDDKKYQVDGFNTLAYGHVRISQPPTAETRPPSSAPTEHDGL